MKGLWLSLSLALGVTTAAVGWYFWDAAAKRNAAIEALVEETATELGRRPVDRDRASDLLRRLATHSSANVDARIATARGRLLLELDRNQDAWTVLSPFALEFDSGPEPLRLAARASFAMYCRSRDFDVLARAMDLALRDYRQSGDRGSLFLAWRCANIGGHVEDRDECARLLAAQHADSDEAAVVAAVGAETVDRGTLVRLGEKFYPPLPEIEVPLVALQLAADEDVEGCLRRLEDVLARCGASVDARNFAAIAAHKLGDAKRRNAYLDWLLANADVTDQRRDTWQLLREAPIDG